MHAKQEEGRADNGDSSVRGGSRPLPRRAVVRSLSTMHMMGFTPLGFFETVSEGENLVEGAMSLPYAGQFHVSCNSPVVFRHCALNTGACATNIRVDFDSTVTKLSYVVQVSDHLELARSCFFTLSQLHLHMRSYHVAESCTCFNAGGALQANPP